MSLSIIFYLIDNTSSQKKRKPLKLASGYVYQTKWLKKAKLHQEMLYLIWILNVLSFIQANCKIKFFSGLYKLYMIIIENIKNINKKIKNHLWLHSVFIDRLVYVNDVK